VREEERKASGENPDKRSSFSDTALYAKHIYISPLKTIQTNASKKMIRKTNVSSEKVPPRVHTHQHIIYG